MARELEETHSFDVGLDDDLRAVFNAGIDQQLILQIQIVRLLRALLAKYDAGPESPKEPTE